MNLFELFVKIGVDDKASPAMKNTQKNSETLANKMKSMSAQFESAQKNIDNLTKQYNKSAQKTGETSQKTQELSQKLNSAKESLETTKNKLAVLASQYDTAKKNVADLTKEFNKSAKETGASSKETQELAKKLDDAEKEAEQAKKALDGYNSELGETETKTKKAGGSLSNFASKLGKGLATAAKIGAAAVGAAAAGITALTTAAVNNYAEYEQLVGGVDTLFKNASQKVQQYAADAYKTAGMSANDYMANATAFSASLISSLGGDTEKAAEYANRAMVSMSDNANRMGTSLDSIVQTYQSLSRGNMAMLDNLKLGYGGTKAELERLIKDAASYTDIQKKLGITVDASSMSFDNIVNAIAVVQEKLGIAGATAQEAGTTIQGSVISMKAAWSNLVTGIVDKNADLEKLIDNFVVTIVGDGTANNLGVLGNIMPAVKSALNGAAKLVSNLLPRIIQEIPDIIDQNLPVLIKSAFDIIENVFKGLKKNKTKLIKSIGKAVSYIFDTITNPDTIQGLFDVALELVETLADMLLRDDVLDKMIDSAVKIVVTLGDFIVNNVDRLFEVATKIVTSLLGYLLDPENIGKILEAGAKIIQALGKSFVKAIEGLSSFITDIAAWLVKKFTGIDLSEAGKEVMKTFFMGLLGVAKAQTINVSDLFSGVSVDGSHRSGLSYVPYDGYIAELHKGERVLTASEARGYGAGTSIGNITINIDGAKYSDEQSLAEAVAEAIQEMTDRRSAVYA